MDARRPWQLRLALAVACCALLSAAVELVFFNFDFLNTLGVQPVGVQSAQGEGLSEDADGSFSTNMFIDPGQAVRDAENAHNPEREPVVSQEEAAQTGVYDDGRQLATGEAGESAADDARERNAADADEAAAREGQLLSGDETRRDEPSKNKRSYTFELAEGAQLQTICFAYAAEGDVQVEVELRDEGHALYQSQGSVSLGRTNTAGDEDAERIVRLHPTGDASSVRVTFDANRSWRASVSFNQPIPLDFNLQRFLTLALVALCIFAVRPASALRRIPASKGLYLALGAASCVFIVAYAWLRSPYLSVDGTAESQYFELAQALAHGQLFLDDVPSDALAGLSNPYDTALRDAAGVSARWDTAYFQGRYYVYFGVLPVILFHLPCYLLFGAAFPNWLAAGLSTAAFAVGVLFLAHTVARLWRRSLSCAELVVVFVCVMAVSFAGDALRFPAIYVVPIAVGLALVAWGLALWLRAVDVPKGHSGAGWALAGSACMAAVVLVRPQLLAFSLLGPVLVVPALRRQRDVARGACLLVCALAPYVLFFALAACYNAARFGSPLDFGASYNLTSNDLTHRGFDVQRALSGVFVYLFQLPNYCVNYPYIAGTDGVQGYFGTMSLERPVGGLLALFPAVALAFLLLFSKDVRSRVREKGLLAACVLSFVLAVALAAFDANGGGLIERYYMDFGFMLGVGALFILVAANMDGMSATVVKGEAVPLEGALDAVDAGEGRVRGAEAKDGRVEGMREGQAFVWRRVFTVAFALTLLDAVMWLGSSYSVFS